MTHKLCRRAAYRLQRASGWNEIPRNVAYEIQTQLCKSDLRLCIYIYKYYNRYHIHRCSSYTHERRYKKKTGHYTSLQVESKLEFFCESNSIYLIWEFPKIMVPQNGWFIKMENPMNKWMIWGYSTPIFGSTPI